MSSIWDVPVVAGADASAPSTPVIAAAGVATVDPSARIMGTQAGPLFTAQGRGVKAGVPYGLNEQARLQEMNRMYLLRPDWKARLVEASRAALGR